MDIDRAWARMLLQSQVAYIGKSGDSQQILLDIIGLHPGSVELSQRFANSLNQIHNIYNAQCVAHGSLDKLYSDNIQNAAALLARYGYTIGKGHPEPEIFKKVFDENSFLLKGARIDRVPNSEIKPIGSWTEDGKNYISWLIAAAGESHDCLRLQAGFNGGKPPTALLYLLLHHALDLSYIDTCLMLYLNRGVMTSEEVREAYIEPDLIHIQQGQQTESRWRPLYRPEFSITGDRNILMAEWIPQHIGSLYEAAAFRDVLAGLRQLEKVPTASLERLLMEHIDTVSYRLDAWIQGYLHLQLANMRGIVGDEPAPSSRRGLYLGAYGWLEEVRPENKVLTSVQLPRDLNEIFNPEGDLVADESNAGYILAPSQNHAVTAAILRNGHLSNEDRDALKIKLSSERVRSALQIIEGIQSGQPLAALLGYQFERGLHDRTDAEVDSFIFDLRNQFPLVAKKFKDTAPGPDDFEYESISSIEARNVLDGAAFLKYIEKTGERTYPFGLELPEASELQKAAINAEILGLIELNDAVADLALAESVHQVVLGNYERATAALDTYSKGNFPPTPDVTQTPRSGIVLTHRVALGLRTGLSHILGNPGVTPRMVAEPAIQDWLSTIMPDPVEIECVVSFFDGAIGTNAEVPVTMGDLGLAQIDLLYLLNIDGDKALSALDDQVIQHIVTHQSPRMDRPIDIAYAHNLHPARFNVLAVTSLVASLRVMLLNSKALNAADIRLPNEAVKEDEGSLSLDPARIAPLIAALRKLRTDVLAPYLSNLATLVASGNVSSIVAELDDLISDLAAIFGQVSGFGLVQTGSGFLVQWQQTMYTGLRAKVEELIARWDTRRMKYLTLRAAYIDGIGTISDKGLFAILRKAESTISVKLDILPTPSEQFTAVELKFGQFERLLDTTLRPILDIHNLTQLLERIQALSSLLQPFDRVEIDIADQLKNVAFFAADLKNRAESLDREIGKRAMQADNFLARADSTADTLAKVELVKNAAKAIFGDDFVIVPDFRLDAAGETEWKNALDASDHSLRYLLADLDVDFPMDDWLHGISRVREKMYHLENTLLHIEGFNGSTIKLVPAQFPYREEDYWLGMQFPEKEPGTEEPFTIDEDKLLFTTVYPGTFAPQPLQCGLLLDEWTEVIPAREMTIGLTFHYDQPNSEPPQALLLVTPSSFTGHWRWDDLVAALHATLDMAKKRAVEPDHADKLVYSRFLPPIVSLVSPRPLTAMMNLSMNNQVSSREVFGDE